MNFPTTNWQGYLQSAADQIYNVLGRFYMECASYALMLTAAILAAIVISGVLQSRTGRHTRLVVQRSARLALRRLNPVSRAVIRH